MLEAFEKYDELAFGPFVGELGWEVARWSAALHSFKKKFPDKKIYISTREDRVDLYHWADSISTFTISGDYQNYRPNMYRLDGLPDQKLKEMISTFQSQYPKTKLITPPYREPKRDIFNIKDMDFNFEVRPQNKIIIETILSKYPKRLPIVISPRNRTDMSSNTRNWKHENWEKLYDMIDNTHRYICFIVGKTGTYIKPKGNLDSFALLENLCTPIYQVSLIGLTIEAIRHSTVTVGQQSAIPVLSNLLRIPTIMWGHEKHRHVVLENHYNTKCEFFAEKTNMYITPPELIFNEIKTMVG